jgi:hypothetical protein
MPARARVTLQACLRDTNGTRWTSQADFDAKADGTIDISTDAPHSGAYSDADGGGLITSLTVEDATAARPFDSNSIEPLAIDFAATALQAPDIRCVHRACPTSVLAGAFELGGTGPMQARANRAAWTETLAFLGAR